MAKEKNEQAQTQKTIEKDKAPEKTE